MSIRYYQEKISALVLKLFSDPTDARSRIINCEGKIITAHLASKSGNVPIEIQKQWDKIWDELNQKPAYYDHLGKVIHSSFVNTISSKRNKTMVKYLEFFLKEYVASR